MSDSSIASRMQQEDKELADKAASQLPKLDQHSAGATPDEVAPIGNKSHGFGTAIPEEFKKRNK